ncbi:FG-nucleoporin nsp1 [Peltigera leucophlebia]|nr:FG-nucleoporin nsp1 [Peltigera leucophlebia]
MSDPPKFSFGQPVKGGSTSTNLFGQPPSSTSTTSGGLFGTSTGTSAATASNPFAPPTTAASPFGASAFGNNSASAGFNFGQAPGSKALGGGFGTGQTNTASSQPFSSNTPSTGFASTGFSVLSTPSKPSETTRPGQAPSLNMLGSLGKPAGSSQAETSTPVSKPSVGLFGTSTTPAGPPPNNSTGAGSISSSVFNLQKPQEQKPSLFGPSKIQSGFSPSESGKSLFSKPAAATQPSSGLFGQLGKAQDNGTVGSLATATSSDVPTAGIQESTKPSLFSSLSSSTTGANTQSSAPSLFASLGQKPLGALNPGVSAAADSTSPATTTAAPTSNFFAGLGAKNVSSGTATTAGTSGSSLFNPTPNPNTSSTNEPSVISAASGQATSSGAAPKLSGLAGPGTSAAATHTTAPSAAPNIPANTTNIANLGASTTGPAPPAQSRLKNKSMDEIITRWASDLAKYQKEFQRQAEQVASWDRMLVENSDKIQKLYGSTLEAERATTEVERQLTAVENDQEELAVWLDHYEKEVNQMMSNQVGQGDSLQGPDQERDRTYKLAEKLSGRLEEMGKDLSTMIIEINHASSDLSKNSKADDPLSQVVRVLNNHLTQLQQIDQGAAALQAKVTAAQKAGNSTGPSNGFSGPTSEAVDGFYRSYMGRR